MKALRKFCLGGLLLLYAQVGMGQDSIRTEHLQEVKVNARQHRILTSTSPLQLLDKGDMLRLGVTDMADALHRMPGINLRDYGGAGGMKTVAVRGFGAGHTGVSYDGVLLSECQGGEIDVSRYSLDQVQTLRLTIGDNDDIFISARQASVADGNYAVCVTPGATTRMQGAHPYFFVLNAPYGGTPSVSALAAGSTQPQTITLSEMPVSPCGIFADPLNGHIFVLSYKMGDSGYADYNGNGYVVEYDSAGQKQHEYETGVGSCAMFFDSAYKTAYSE
jgi:hypothetical protein